MLLELDSSVNLKKGRKKEKWKEGVTWTQIQNFLTLLTAALLGFCRLFA